MWPQANLARILLAFFQPDRVYLILEGGTFPSQAFSQIPRSDLGAYRKELSTGVSFLQKMLTEGPFSAKEEWEFWSSAPAVSSPQTLPGAEQGWWSAHSPQVGLQRLREDWAGVGEAWASSVGAASRRRQRTLSFTHTSASISTNLSFDRRGKQCSKASACKIVSQYCSFPIKLGGSIQALILSEQGPRPAGLTDLCIRHCLSIVSAFPGQVPELALSLIILFLTLTLILWLLFHSAPPAWGTFWFIILWGWLNETFN